MMGGPSFMMIHSYGHKTGNHSEVYVDEKHFQLGMFCYVLVPITDGDQILNIR